MGGYFSAPEESDCFTQEDVPFVRDSATSESLFTREQDPQSPSVSISSGATTVPSIRGI